MKILITGGTGLVGSAFKEIKTDHDLIFLSSKECDLRDNNQVNLLFNKYNPDAVIHLAAKVGGVKGNSDFISDYFYDNIQINTNVLNAAKNLKIKKVLSLLSTCIYPDNPKYPLTEDQIHNGEPHKSNFGYAYAKRMLEVQSRAIRQQHNLKYITAVPNNIYGPFDNFDLENGHVIPALIRKIYESKITGNAPVLWGSGKSLREFTYSQDIAKAALFLLENYNEKNPINIGNTNEYSIKYIAETISKLLEYNGEIIWNKNMPEGQFKKPSCNKSFLKICPNFEYTSFKAGLEKTCDWFIKNYPSVRGIN